MPPRLPAGLEFLLRRPAPPPGAPVPRRRPPVGVDYETAWARRLAVRAARAAVLDAVARPALEVLARPRVVAPEVLDPLEGPLVLVANHASHLDTPLVLASLPARLRHRCVVAAAADYFFDRRWKATLWAAALGSIPMERTKANRRSADLAATLLEEGWSLLIFPEGGRSTDGWGQEFKGGAAYLARRCGVPVVPVHLEGTRAVLPKGAAWPRLGEVVVRFGRPLAPGPGEDARRFSERLERAVAELADEAASDWWAARRRAGAGTTPPLRGPDVSPWRRAWALPPGRGGGRERERAWPFGPRRA
jgi:1-acyl-sn-glycerol-3-phosphate acyltransferase